MSSVLRQWLSWSM